MQLPRFSSIGLALLISSEFVIAHAQTVDSFVPSVKGPVSPLALQPDGAILLGGSFDVLGGEPQYLIGRLNEDGARDPTFSLDTGQSSVSGLAFQTDGKILMAGSFRWVAGEWHFGLVRVNQDGSIDEGFQPGLEGYVYALALQPDGKILLGGFLFQGPAQNRLLIGRLDVDGTFDSTFNPTFGDQAYVSSLVVQPDGKILLGGSFKMLNGQSRTNLARLNPNGTIDLSFTPKLNGSVESLLLQADQKILILDYDFTDQPTRFGLSRLNTDGTLDASFEPSRNPDRYALALQADGKILVGGSFLNLAGENCTNIGRLNIDGRLDHNFNALVDAGVASLTIQADGKILVSGWFKRLGGQSLPSFGRLNNTEPATELLTFDGSALRWMRGGTSPEVWRTTFEYSLDAGTSWTKLGDGTRVPGGWQLTGLSLPANPTFRARGHTLARPGSIWFVETFIGPPAILLQPASLTNEAAATATFSVRAGGNAPFGYQWSKNGINLADGGNISGASTTRLTLGNVLGSDHGNYSVVITNALGSVTSAVAKLTVIDPVVSLQPLSQTANLGGTVTFSVGVAGTPPFSYQWRRDGMTLSGTTQSMLTLTNLLASDAANYDVIVANVFGNTTSLRALLSINLAAVDLFDPRADVQNQWDWGVLSMAVQPDGKILIGGEFTILGGQNRTNLARLNADGTLDTSFDPAATNTIYSLAVQPDAKIVVGTVFRRSYGALAPALLRLNTDGAVDTSFDPSLASIFSGNVRSGTTVALQADGKILFGGDSYSLNLVRFNPDGTLDTNFTFLLPYHAGTIALQPDGRILMGGYYDVYPNLAVQDKGGGARPNDIAPIPYHALVRLNSDGTLDPGFNQLTNQFLPSFDWRDYGGIGALALQADGKILVGGWFSFLAGQTRTNIARLNSDGTLDASFNPGADGGVASFALQADGKILVAGGFTILGGQNRTNIGRLNADGTVDPTFNPGAAGFVNALALQPDGKLLVGGVLSNLGSLKRTNLGRIENIGPASSSLFLNGSTLTWLRGGTSPEVWRTTFEATTNAGLSWTELGAGIRTADGWQLAGSAVPTNATIRARGFTAGGNSDDSSWFVESVIGPLAISRQPDNRTNNAGTTAVFSVHSVGNGPLTYEWRKNGAAITDGDKVSGAHTATLTLANVLGEDAGGYSVIIHDSVGSVASVVASLVVLDPVINISPLGQVRNPGESVTFNVAATGTTPLSYQWRKDGLPQIGATASSLTFTNLRGSDAGSYDLVVTNVWGSATSSVALLSVNMVSADAFAPVSLGAVSCLAIESDTKIMIGDLYNNFEGFSFHRFNPDGMRDMSFVSQVSGSVHPLALLPDGKILGQGVFNTSGGQNIVSLGRLNLDGSIAPGFSASLDDRVSSLALQSDGRIMVLGNFRTLAGQARNMIGRLNSDGSLDTNFNPGLIVEGSIQTLALQPDGKSLLGGNYSVRLGNRSYSLLCRLNADGILDSGFAPDTGASVNCVVVQPDAKILFGGSYHLGRLNSDGTRDSSFNPTIDDFGHVTSLALQADGKIIVGGQFTRLDGQTRTNIARLNADGTLDLNFNPGAGRFGIGVYALALQTDGKILVGGNFTMLGGQNRTNIGRLNNTEPATQNLSFDGTNIFWMRGGSSPEVWCTSFEYTTNGTAWSYLGAGVHIAGGWQLTGVSLAGNPIIRARGYVIAGGYNGSSWFVETLWPPALAISEATYSSSGQFQLNALGRPGQVVIIEGSPDLRIWTPLQTNALGNAPISFTDPEAAHLPTRFYRLRQQP